MFRIIDFPVTLPFVVDGALATGKILTYVRMCNSKRIVMFDLVGGC